ncbi:hypothetical protein HSBAA_52560 [Vreelandella sulfidaeris]|uniref:Uncharacterized protein n=1 Tax=Vreelandella sulfidaeris TaxID=115553 RepID=A0A455UCI9_9GAMM|nr:hypothetical protein HSBAA_52560 [Halomonas sulfidaeris]
MVSNPEWVATVSQWKSNIAKWASERDGDSLMKLAIMLDAHAVAGNPVCLKVSVMSCSNAAPVMSYCSRILPEQHCVSRPR